MTLSIRSDAAQRVQHVADHGLGQRPAGAGVERLVQALLGVVEALDRQHRARPHRTDPPRSAGRPRPARRRASASSMRVSVCSAGRSVDGLVGHHAVEQAVVGARRPRRARGQAGPRHEGRGRALEHLRRRRWGRRRPPAPRPRAPPRRCRAPRGSCRTEMTGFDGPRMIARARRRSRRGPPAGARAASTPCSSTPSTGPSPRSRIMNSWKGTQRPRARTRVRTGWSAIGSTRAPSPSAARELADGLGERRALGQALRAAQADGEVAVAEVEPDVDARARAAASIALKVSPRRPQPRSSMRSASQKAHRSGSGQT